MNKMINTLEQLAQQKCAPCPPGTAPLSSAEAEEHLAALEGWQLSRDGQRIKKAWSVDNFLAGLAFFGKVAEIAEAEGHHPDLHLEGYKNVWIEIWTHDVGGLSSNDFILAAKIEQLAPKSA